MQDVMKIGAIVLLSGGLDSAVALYWAKSRNYQILCLTFDYFLRSKREIRAAKIIAKLNSIQALTIKLPFLREIEDSKLLNSSLKKAELAYIPSRNIIFYGIASSLAEISKARYIVGGHNKDDIKQFPDSSMAFFDSFNATTKIGLFSGEKTGRVILPLARSTKAEVVKLGHKLGVPYELTWSCYRSSTRPCGVCHSCRLRRSAFSKAGVNDPLAMDK
jgi:7-cyano-7-deazaguanine synthase